MVSVRVRGSQMQGSGQSERLGEDTHVLLIIWQAGWWEIQALRGIQQ